jgi:VWFA-related protein
MMHPSSNTYRTLLVVIVLCVFAASVVFSQQKKDRDFGSSLRDLKWDPARKTGVNTGAKAQPSQSDELDEDDVIRVDSTLVVCDVLVADKQGRGITGLTGADFIITDDDQPQEIATFTLGDDPNKPRSIVLLMDHSGSQYPYLEKSISAAKTLVRSLRPIDEMAIVTDNVELLVDYTADKKKLAKALDKLKEKADEGQFGMSWQYSALMATLRELVTGKQRPIVIFQTDGDELSRLQSGASPKLEGAFREFSLVDVINAAERVRVTIYTVIPNFQIVGLSPEEQVNRVKARLSQGMAQSISVDRFNAIVTAYLKEQTALEGLSKLSGGWTEFLEKPEDASRIYSRILTDINRRYILGFQPSNKTRDGKRRRLKIEVKDHPEYIVWGRKFYYAQSSASPR